MRFGAPTRTPLHRRRGLAPVARTLSAPPPCDGDKERAQQELALRRLSVQVRNLHVPPVNCAKEATRRMIAFGARLRHKLVTLESTSELTGREARS